jgi:hypothetical protein
MLGQLDWHSRTCPPAQTALAALARLGLERLGTTQHYCSPPSRPASLFFTSHYLGFNQIMSRHSGRVAGNQTQGHSDDLDSRAYAPKNGYVDCDQYFAIAESLSAKACRMCGHEDCPQWPRCPDHHRCVICHKEMREHPIKPVSPYLHFITPRLANQY